MKKEILRLEHIDCIVSGKHLLSDLSLNVYEHEALCILGMKNAGKTLLVDYLTGEASIAGGQVYFNDVKIENPANLKHKNMAVSRITKDTYLITNLSIATNFYIALEESARLIYSKSKAHALAQACLNDFNIKISAETRVDTLNKCHQHIVAMCIAFFRRSKLIIVDDAMAGYSAQDIADFQEFLDILKRRDLAVVLMTHNIEYATMLSDRLVVLKDGSNIKTLTNSQFNKNLITRALLDAPEQPLYRKKNTEYNKIAITLSLYANDEQLFKFETTKGTIVSIFDPYNLLCNSLEQYKYGDAENPVIHSVNGREQEFRSVDQAIRQQTILIFEDYFTDGLFENSNLTTNIEFFSFERLAVGPVGYMSKRRESVLLKDSSFYRNRNENRHSLFGREKALYQHDILLERLRMFSPEIIICIKSLSVLDPYLINMTLNCFRDLAERGTSVFILNNDYSAFSKVFDKVYVIRESKIEAVLTSEELQNTDLIAKYLITSSSGII